MHDERYPKLGVDEQETEFATDETNVARKKATEWLKRKTSSSAAILSTGITTDFFYSASPLGMQLLGNC